MSHDRLLMPHPVLRPGGFDYREGTGFGMSINARRTEEHVTVDASLDLSCDTLQSMIRDGTAGFFVLVRCPKTYHRSRHAAAGGGPGESRIAIRIPAGELAGRAHLTPYVAASREIERFASEEHDEEIRGLTGGVPRGSILAVGATHEVEIDRIGRIQSAIKMVSNPDVDEGMYLVNADGDFILVEMGPRTFNDVSRIRQSADALLFPSVYQAAIEYAIRQMGDNEDSAWAAALRKTLDKHGISVDENLPKHAHEHAQTLLDRPLLGLVRWGDRRPEP